MVSKNRQAMSIALVAGIFLLIAGINGVTTWETIKNFVTEHLLDHQMVQILFATLIFIASLGGIAVILGGILIGKNKVRTGKFIIAIGAGIGIIGLIFSLFVAVFEGSLTIGGYLSIGTIGLILSVVARVVAEKE